MSQRGPAPPRHDASRLPTQGSSPPSPKREQSGPSAGAPQQLGAGRPRDESQREQPTFVRPASASGGEDPSRQGQQHAFSRTLGVPHILNPSESSASRQEAGRGIATHEGGGNRPTMALGQGQGQGRDAGTSHPPFIFQGQPPTAPQPRSGFPPSMTPPGPPPSSRERGSPTSSHPPPALGGPRRLLNPRSPHGVGMSRSLAFSPFAPHQQGPRPGPYGEQGSGTPPRSLSQPIIGLASQVMQARERAGQHAHQSPLSQPPQLQQQQQQQQQGGPGRDQQPPQQQAQQQQGRTPPVFSAGTAFGPGLSAGGPAGESQWSAGLMRSGQPGGGGRAMSVSDPQQFITITPSYGEEIHVPVDIHQASKQADEKRLRNAGASARFRARKKEKDKEVQVGMQRLENQNSRLEGQNRELARRLHDAEVERDHYRTERNRLRSAMLQAGPGPMRDIAESGPPSPTSTTRSGGSFAAESSPMSQHLQPHSQTVPSYVSDGAEHPARRRRTEPPLGAPEFTTPTYGPPGQMGQMGSGLGSPLPPMPHGGFSAAPGPSPLGGGGQRQLPPMRGERPSLSPTSEHPPSVPPPPISAPPGSASQYPPYSRAPYEAGWATGPPRSMYDPNQGPR